ncbi:MAG: NAD-dependent epimerase/dehydratase family protein [Bacteroidales bacterium]|nr:NAD-dependent epimerase/dehydratase family protein [Bacteroidales bacterium]
MKVLFIGGSGNISSACTNEAVENGIEVFHFNRCNKHPERLVPGVTSLEGDYSDNNSLNSIVRYAPFDVIANFICFTPEQMARDIDFFGPLTRQYIFISSATVYKKPPDHYIVTEDCPLENPYWPYAQKKIACEKLLSSQKKVPFTIVRPSYTYGNTWIPMALTARQYNPVYRIREGLPIISHGDGESLWITTHNSDFARAFVQLFDNDRALNEHFHITSDEVHTWDQIYGILGSIVGREPELIHIPSDFIHQHEPEWGEGLLGDKARSVVFDNTKIKSVTTNWQAVKSLKQGLTESVEWFESDPERAVPDQSIEERTNKLIYKYLNR